MNKGKRIILSFSIVSAIWFGVLCALVVLMLLFKAKIDEYYIEPINQGLCPSVGLGVRFISKDMDLMIEKYAIYLQETTGTPQFYDRVRDTILENYTLVGDTYYYNNYLLSDVQIYESINFIPYLIVSSVLFVISLTTGISCIRRCSEDEIRTTKKFAVVIIVFSCLSLNVYAVYRFIKYCIIS